MNRKCRFFVAKLALACCLPSLVAQSQEISLTIRLQDDQGNPIAGAEVGRSAYGESNSEPRWRFHSPSAISDEAGFARLQARVREDRDDLLLYALSDDRRLVALHRISFEKIDDQIEIILVPSIRVHGKLISTEFDAMGREMEGTDVLLSVDNVVLFSFFSYQQEFDFYLPPGDYGLHAYGKNLAAKGTKITVLSEEESKDLGSFDLPISALAKLFGQPAPELQQIKAWRGGDPVMLEELRGKVVILDFWGYWCGPCIFQMPNLISLFDDFHEHGLEVIAVHDDSLPGSEELEQHLTAFRQQKWFGRDLPFRVAIDGGSSMPLEGSDSTARGATTAAYGITAFPTAVLINREGLVEGVFHPTASKSIERLAKLLDLIPEDAGLDDLPTPEWKQTFNEVYQLAPDELVKWIEPPFIAERSQFITLAGRYVGQGCEVKSLVIFGERRNQFTDGTLGELLQALASRKDISSLFDCPAELLRLEIGGDWVVRETAPLDERLAEVQSIINSKLEHPLHFELVEVEQEVITVSGSYRFQSLPTAINQRVIYVTADPESLTPEVGGGTGTAGVFFDWLSKLLHQPVINTTTLPDSDDLQWSQCESAIANFRVENPPELDPILANLAQQTGLEFKRVRSLTTVWRVRRASN